MFANEAARAYVHVAKVYDLLQVQCQTGDHLVTVLKLTE